MHPPGCSHILSGELNGDGAYQDQISYSGQSLAEGDFPAGAFARMIPCIRGDIRDEGLGHGYFSNTKDTQGLGYFPDNEIIQPETAGRAPTA